MLCGDTLACIDVVNGSAKRLVSETCSDCRIAAEYIPLLMNVVACTKVGSCGGWGPNKVGGLVSVLSSACTVHISLVDDAIVKYIGGELASLNVRKVKLTVYPQAYVECNKATLEFEFDYPLIEMVTELARRGLLYFDSARVESRPRVEVYGVPLDSEIVRRVLNAEIKHMATGGHKVTVTAVCQRYTGAPVTIHVGSYTNSLIRAVLEHGACRLLFEFITTITITGENIVTVNTVVLDPRCDGKKYDRIVAQFADYILFAKFALARDDGYRTEVEYSGVCRLWW